MNYSLNTSSVAMIDFQFACTNESVLWLCGNNKCKGTYIDENVDGRIQIYQTNLEYILASAINSLWKAVSSVNKPASVV